jgi:hypothetical protein
MDYTNKKITLGDGITYLVINQVNYNNSIYLYIVNKDNEDDTKFVEVKNDELLSIDPELFDTTIFPLFMEEFRK